MSAQGLLIAFEGIDGSGKSSTMRRVAGALHEAGHDVVTTREETESWRGEAVRRSISDRADPWTTLHLFLADRASHVAEIAKHLDEGRTVLCDRFMHSTLAYQSVTLATQLENPLDHLRRLHEPWCIKPDHVVLFDVNVEVAMGRVNERAEATNYEKADFLTKVQAAYQAMVDTDDFTVVDSSRKKSEVAADVAAAIEGWLA